MNLKKMILWPLDLPTPLGHIYAFFMLMLLFTPGIAVIYGKYWLLKLLGVL